MLIGYMRVSKADGSQATDLQRDALVAAGVDPADALLSVKWRFASG
jgi:DNA invertase Pin-like site-specific DNA recombinase